MSTVFGAPLVGKLFTPVMFVFTVLYLVMAVARWLQGDRNKLKEEETTAVLTEALKNDVLSTETMDEFPNRDIKKKTKKKKSCCGTKGSCCKTKKDSGDEKKGSCGCGCSSKKETKEGEAADGSCSSDAEGSDSDEVTQVLDVEELGIMAEGLIPDLATHSPPRPNRISGVPKGRVRLRNADQAKQSVEQKNKVFNETEES